MASINFDINGISRKKNELLTSFNQLLRAYKELLNIKSKVPAWNDKNSEVFYSKLKDTISDLEKILIKIKTDRVEDELNDRIKMIKELESL